MVVWPLARSSTRIPAVNPARRGVTPTPLPGGMRSAVEAHRLGASPPMTPGSRDVRAHPKPVRHRPVFGRDEVSPIDLETVVDLS